MFPIYLFEDNVEQRNSYREIINKTIMINEFAMELRTVTDDQKAILTSLDQKNGLFF